MIRFSEDRLSVAEYLELRASVGWVKLTERQAELAIEVGVRRETIVFLENGKYNPSLKLAMDIAKYFGKSVEEVFSFVDDDEE